MNKAFLSTAVFLLLMITASCSGESEEKSGVTEPAVTNSSQIEFFTVEVEEVSDRVSLSGRIRAEHRIELFPEVQGKVMERTKQFREGIFYEEGEVIIQLDDTETKMQLQSSRSKFKTLVSALMADIKLDHPEMLSKYEEWYHSMAADQKVPRVPDFGENMQRFLESKGVYELYYSIKSAEERFDKFTIRAPFSGVLSAAKAEPDQVVGPQFHLGTLVDTSRFILTASVQTEEAEWIQPGLTMEIKNKDQTETYSAKVARVNPSVELSSQQVQIYLEVTGNNLREGIYLEGEIESDNKRELARIPKTALLRTGGVLINKEGVLEETPVQIVNLERSHLWVEGLKNGDKIAEDVSVSVAGRIIN
jgi:membrane fusion protein, multidrug efflux system